MDSWFDEMLRERPSLVEGLQSHGITSASAYMKVAETLPVEILDEVERFRFMRLLPSINREDPFQIVNIAPPWVLELTISHLELTVRCQNVLERENIKIISELKDYQLETAMRWKDFGKKSAQDLSSGLMAAIMAGAPHFKLAAMTISEGRHEQDEEWFAELSDKKPSLVAELAIQGIVSASTYMQRRELLSEGVWEELDGFRFTHMVSLIDRDDPFQIVRIAPSWLLRVLVTQLELTARCANALRRNAIKSVGDLLNYQFCEAIRWKNFGKKSARDLSLGLQHAIKQGSQHFHLAAALNNLVASKRNNSYAQSSITESGDILETPTSTSLKETILIASEGLKDRERIVFQGRLMTYPRLTLEQIGDQIGVTRERVRQLEDRYLRVLEKRYFFPTLIGLKIARLFKARTSPLYLDAIHEEDPWFSGFSNETGKLSTLIRAFSDWYTFEVDNRMLVSAIGDDEFDNLKRKALESLRNNDPMVLKESDVTAILRDLTIEAGAPELGDVLSTVLQEQLHFTSPTETSEPLLSGVGWGVRHTVIALLNEAEQPLHYSELTRRCSARLGREVEERRVHSILITENAQCYGRGTYGTNSHFPFGQDLRNEVRTELENIMLTHSGGRQWHVAELVDLLGDLRPDLPEDVDQYIVNIVLEESTVLKPLGRLLWTVAGKTSSDLSESVERIDVTDACEAILKTAGRPMSLEEIRFEVTKQRGVGKYFLLQPSKTLSRTNPNTWGLVSRDFYCTDVQRRRFLDCLALVMAEEKKGLFPFEVRRLLRNNGEKMPDGISDYMIMSLVQTDERFRVRRGQVIALASWPESQRITPREAVSRLIGIDDGPWEFNALATEVQRLTERQVSQSEITSLLYQNDLWYDSLTLTWRRTSDALNDPMQAVMDALGITKI